MRPHRYRSLVIEDAINQPIGEITIRRLAWISKLRVPKFRALLDAGILEVVKKDVSIGRTVVKQPTPAKMEWIKQMLKPLNLRPLIRLREVAEMLGLRPIDLRERCSAKNLKFFRDPAYGELLTPQDVGRVLRAGIVDTRVAGRWRFDRMSLLQFLTGDEWGREMRYKVLPYSVYLEREVKRIAKLPEPNRTLRAVALYEAFQDAKSLSKGLHRYWKREKPVEGAVAAEKAIENLMSVVNG